MTSRKDGSRSLFLTWCRNAIKRTTLPQDVRSVADEDNCELFIERVQALDTNAARRTYIMHMLVNILVVGSDCPKILLPSTKEDIIDLALVFDVDMYMVLCVNGLSEKFIREHWDPEKAPRFPRSTSAECLPVPAAVKGRSALRKSKSTPQQLHLPRAGIQRANAMQQRELVQTARAKKKKATPRRSGTRTARLYHARTYSAGSLRRFFTRQKRPQSRLLSSKEETPQ